MKALTSTIMKSNLSTDQNCPTLFTVKAPSYRILMNSLNYINRLAHT